MKSKLTPMQQAILKLRTTEPDGTGSATAKQISDAAVEFDLGHPGGLEGLYLEACDRSEAA